MNNATKHISVLFENENRKIKENMDESLITVYFAFVRRSDGQNIEGMNGSDNQKAKNTFVIHGTIELKDCLRPGAKQVVADLQRRWALEQSFSVVIAVMAYELSLKTWGERMLYLFAT